MVGEKSGSINGLSVYHTCLLNTIGIIRGLLRPPLGLPQCWPKMNRLPVIFPAKMGLFEFNKDLQYVVCKHGELLSSALAQEGEEYSFKEGNREWRCCYKQRVHWRDWESEVYWLVIGWTGAVSYWLVSYQAKKGVCFFPVGLCCHHGAREFHLLSFRLYFFFLRGKISLYCNINLTNKPSTARNTE